MVKEIDNININYNDYIGALVKYNPKSGKIIISNNSSGVKAEENIENGIDKDGNQTFETEELEWRIWDYDGEKLRIISETPTTKKLTLSGAKGYNNGVWILNEICRQCYGTGENGVNPLNLKKSDIQKVTTYNYRNYSHNNGDSVDKNKDGTYKYGDTKKYTTYYKYPEICENIDFKWIYDSDENEIRENLVWEEEGNGKGNLIGIEDGSYDTEFRESYWRHDYDATAVNNEEWINPKYYELLFKDKEGNFFGENASYWLASRYTSLGDTFCTFGIQNVNAHSGLCDIFGNTLYYSRDLDGSVTNVFRPIVSINLRTSGYSLEKVEDNLGNVSFELKK